MTIVIFLFVVSIMQDIAIELSSEIARMLGKRQRDISQVQPIQISEAEKRLERIHHSGKSFLPDGTIHLTHRLGRTPGRFDEPEKIQIYDANDTLIWQGFESENPYEYLSWSDQRFNPYRIYYGDLTERQMNELQMITPEFSRVAEIPVLAQDGTVQIWRYLPTGDLFMGYRSDRSIIGFLGSTGFTRSKSEARPFGSFKLQLSWYPAGTIEPTVLWQTSRCLYEINFQRQQVRLVFESPQADIKTAVLRDCRAIDTQMPKEQKIKYRPTIHLVTEDNKHHLIMKNPEQTLTITLPDDRWSDMLFFIATTEGIFIVHHDFETRMPTAYSESPKLFAESSRKFEGKPYKRLVELYKVDNQANLHLLNRYEWTIPLKFGPKVQRTNFRNLVQIAATAFSSPIYDLAWFLLGRDFFTQLYRGIDFISFVVRTTAGLPSQKTTLNLLLSLAMVGLAFLHGWPRRTSWRKLIFWLAFTLVFNLAGLLTYLALNHTTIIKCPACNKRRGLAQINCIRCGTELPAPKQRKLDLILNT